MKTPHPSHSPKKLSQGAEFRSAWMFPWTKEEDELLGKFNDRELEAKFNRSAASIKSRRHQLGIPALNGKPQSLKLEMPVQLDSKSDKELRALLGWSVRKIHQQRRSFPRQRERKSRPWSIEEDRLLGTKPDHTLAKMLVRSTAAVKQRRNLKRIWLVRLKWTSADDRLLGKRPDHEIAQLLGRKTWQITWRRRKRGIPNYYLVQRWSEKQLAMVGVMSDKEVARLSHHTVKAVARKRFLMGKPKPDPVMVYWTADQDKLLGAMSDDEVAKRTGRSILAVRKRRRRLRIPN